MSRLGKKPVNIPETVTVNLTDSLITVKGPRGELLQSIVGQITVKNEDNQVLVTRNDETKTSNMNQV